MRLFVAVNLPDREKTRLAGVLADLHRTDLPVGWVAADSIHITIKFLGEVADSRTREIRDALERAAAGVAPFDVALGGFGAFPTPTRPRVFWIGVAAPPAMHELQQHVEHELLALGFAREARAFSPHLTLGRARDAVRLDRAGFDRIAPHPAYEAAMHVDALDLMRSHLGRGGARYELLERVMLKG